jgi:hypothetical protein
MRTAQGKTILVEQSRAERLVTSPTWSAPMLFTSEDCSSSASTTVAEGSWKAAYCSGV